MVGQEPAEATEVAITSATSAPTMDMIKCIRTPSPYEFVCAIITYELNKDVKIC